MNKGLKWLIWVVIVALVVWGLTNKKGGEGSKTSSNGSDTIKVGVIAPLTGEVSNIGEASRSSIMLAEEEINAAGGIGGKRLEVVYEDGKCGAPAAAAAQKLMDIDKVSAIVGGACSSETASFVKTAMEKKIPVISYCSSAPTLTGSGKYFFRNYVSDAYSGVYAAEYLNSVGAKKVAIVYPVTDWGTGLESKFKSEFEKLGGTVVLSEGIKQDSKDFRTVLAKIKAQNPDYIFMALYTNGGTTALNQAKELGIKTKILFPETGEDPAFIKAVPAGMDLVYYIQKSPSNPEFVAKLQAKGVKEVPACSPQAYDAMKLTAYIMNKTGTNPDAFADEMHKVAYEGVSGKNAFDANGDLAEASFVLKRVENGKATEIK